MISLHDVMKYLLCNCTCRISVKDPHRRDTPPETPQKEEVLQRSAFEQPVDSLELLVQEIRRHRRASI